MLANFFSKSKPINYIVLFLLFLSYFFVASIKLYFSNKADDFIFHLIILLIGFAFLFLSFVFIVSKNKLTLDHTYSLLFFILFLGFFPKTLTSSSYLYINILLLLFYRKVYSLKNSTAVFRKIFDAGFWLGITFVFLPATCVFLLLLYAGILIHQKTTIQTLFIPVLGFVIPLFLYFTYAFFTDNTQYFLLLLDFPSSIDFSIYKEPKIGYSLLFIIGFIFLSFFLKTSKVFSVNDTFKKSWILIFTHLIITVFIVIILNNKDETTLIFLFFPMAIIMANGIESIQKKWIKESVLLLFVVATFLGYFL